MGRLRIMIPEHNAIRRSPAIQAELRKIAAGIAAEAGIRADEPGGYGTDLTVGTDRARAHVWPDTPKAYQAEMDSAPLLQIVGDMGAG